tara:strand:+ start:260 stop:442 length:183 start_codon:yes stop_codon:yes gene_type:complete
MNNARRILVIKVAEQIVEDVSEEVFGPLEVLLQDVPTVKLEAFIPKEKGHDELAKSTRVD